MVTSGRILYSKLRVSERLCYSGFGDLYEFAYCAGGPVWGAYGAAAGARLVRHHWEIRVRRQIGDRLRMTLTGCLGRAFRHRRLGKTASRESKMMRLSGTQKGSGWGSYVVLLGQWQGHGWLVAGKW